MQLNLDDIPEQDQLRGADDEAERVIAEARAAKLVRDAREQAQRIISDAHHDAEQIRRDAGQSSAPAKNAEDVGVSTDQIFQVLRAAHTEEPTNRSQWYRANLEKLATGDIKLDSVGNLGIWLTAVTQGASLAGIRVL